MWKRIKRVVKSNLGRFSADPTAAPARADLDDLGESIEVVLMQVALLEKDLAGLNAEEEALSKKIRAALDAGDRSLATQDASALARVRDSKLKISGQLQAARSVCARAEGVSRDLENPGLQAAADETLARMERELGVPSSRTPARKTVGDDSGGVTAAKTIGGDAGAVPDDAEDEPPSAKTIGGEDAPEPAEATSGGDLVEELERLGQLLEQGVLSEDEFRRAKAKLLG
jgi:phage shock protein A